jgi:hypothetical protein
VTKLLGYTTTINPQLQARSGAIYHEDSTTLVALYFADQSLTLLPARLFPAAASNFHLYFQEFLLL